MVVWDLPPKRKSSPRREEASQLSLGGGWALHESFGPALGQADAKAVGRALAAERKASGVVWAVRGEVSGEEESSACGCASLVLDGIRMHLPEKLFARCYLELTHKALDVCVGFDCVSALSRWAEGSVRLVNERRAGRKAWSGWTCDASQLQRAWEGSVWAEEGGRYSFREEWDWSYDTDYSGSVRRGGKGGHARRSSVAAREHKLIRLKRSPEQGAEQELTWGPCDAAAALASQGPPELWASPPLFERSLKLYEDHLAEMGLTRLSLRFREFSFGWEVRVRWWSVLNPGREPRRGVPHARLRDSTIRMLYDSPSSPSHAFPSAPTSSPIPPSTPCLVRWEQNFSLDLQCCGESFEGASCLDADEMRPHMHEDSPPAPSLLELSQPSPSRSLRRPVPTPTLFPHSPPSPPVAPLPPCSSPCTRLLGSLQAPCLASAARGGLVAFSSPESGLLVLFSHGSPVWNSPSYHRGVEGVGVGSEQLLSCGSDGCVRAWGLQDGLPLSSLQLRGEDADHAHDGLPIIAALAIEFTGVDDGGGRRKDGRNDGGEMGRGVQRDVVCCAKGETDGGVGGGEGSGEKEGEGKDGERGERGWGDGERVAAACGRSVLCFTLSSSGFSHASSLPPLPSAITALTFPPSRLIAGTLHSGVFVWLGAQLLLPSSPPTLHLECGSAVGCLISQSALLISSCPDRTVRVWSSPCCAALPSPSPTPSSPSLSLAARPMTLGGLQTVRRKSTQIVSCLEGCGLPLPTPLPRIPPPHTSSPIPSLPSAPPPGQQLLAIADGGSGVVIWSLSGLSDQLGVEGERGGRISLPHHTVACVALSGGADLPLLACGCEDSTVVLLELSPKNTIKTKDSGPLMHWESRCKWSFATDASVIQIVWSEHGSRLYAATTSGAIYEATLG